MAASAAVAERQRDFREKIEAVEPPDGAKRSPHVPWGTAAERRGGKRGIIRTKITAPNQGGYFWVDDGARTHDTRNHNPMLYQLPLWPFL